MSSEQADFNTEFAYGVYPLQNVTVDQRSIQSRWGYSEYRDLEAPVYAIVVYQEKDGTRNTLYLTDQDLCKRESAAGKTFSYLTPQYTTGTVSGIATLTVTGNGTSWNTAKTSGVYGSKNANASDKFILTSGSEHTSDVEPDSHWSNIASVTNDTTVVLTANNGSGTYSSGNYIIRNCYTVPSGERWSWAIVGDLFCFSNGNVYVQYWDGSSLAQDLNTTTAIKARYLLHYANRLVIGDFGATRDPLGIAWSAEGDPTDWSDSTYGEQQFLDTSSFITGLGKVGSSILVYKRDSIIFGERSGIATSPLQFPRERKGIGCEAPYSIVEFKGTNAFLGRDDFYVIDGDYPVSIGAKVRDKFFTLTGYENIQTTWGFKNDIRNELVWVAETTDGQLGFCWNYRTDEWTIYKFAHEITSAGTGAV